MSFQMVSCLAIQLVLLIAFTAAAPQRSPYAPNPVVYPEVLPQYTSTSNGGDVDSRFGSGTTTPAYVHVPTDPGSLLPVDNLQWIQNNWPRDKIPFNVANSEYLLNHRGGVPSSSSSNNAQNGAASVNSQQASGLRGSFAGGNNNQLNSGAGSRNSGLTQRRPPFP